MTPDQSLHYATLSLFFAGFVSGVGFSALVAIVAIKIGVRVRRVDER